MSCVFLLLLLLLLFWRSGNDNDICHCSWIKDEQRFMVQLILSLIHFQQFFLHLLLSLLLIRWCDMQSLEYRCWIDCGRLLSQSFNILFPKKKKKIIQCGTVKLYRGCKQTCNRRRNFHFHSVTQYALFLSSHSHACMHELANGCDSTTSGLRASLLNIVFYVNIKWDLNAQITHTYIQAASRELSRYQKYVW